MTRNRPPKTSEVTAALEELGQERGYGTLAHLLKVIVLDRETFEATSAVLAAEEMDWDGAWDGVVGPALDALETLLARHGAQAAMAGAQ